MYAMGRLSSYISQGVYTVSAPFHPFGGAVDIIVVQQPDGSFKSSPWYVKFGKFQGVLKTTEKIVVIDINGVEADFHMYLDHKGEAYFLKEVDEEESDSIVFSSSSSSSDETDDQSRSGRKEKFKNYSFDANQPKLENQIDLDGEKIITRTNSRRSRIFGLMFGRKSMKENNMKVEGGDVSMQRVSSLERAEIAADLLEVKWSTNLSTDRSRRDDVSRFSAGNMSVQEADNALQVEDDQSRDSPLVHDSVENSFGPSVTQEATGACDGEVGSCSVSGIDSTDYSNGVNCSEALCLITKEQDEEISVLGESVLEEKFEVISETSTGINKYNVRSACFDNSEKGSESVINVPCEQNPHLAKLEGGTSMHYNVEEPSDERVSFLTSGVPNEESRKLYIETSENTRVGVDSNEQGLETLNLSHGECEGDQEHDQVLRETEKLLPDVSSQPRYSAPMVKENPNNILLPSDGDSDKFHNTNAICGCEGSGTSPDTRSVVIKSPSSCGIHLVTSESGEAEMLEVIHQERITERVKEGTSLETEPNEVFETQFHVTGYSRSCISGSFEGSLEEPSTIPGPHVQIVSANNHSIQEADSQSVGDSSSRRNSISLVQVEDNLGEENELNKLQHTVDFVGDPQGSSTEYLHTKKTHSSNLQLENSEEDAFLFSDIGDSSTGAVQWEDSVFPDSLEIEDGPLVTLNDMEDLDRSCHMDHVSHLSSGELVQECSPNVFEPLLEESRTTSSPMSIPRSRNSAVEELERMIESLPNFRSHIDSLEMPDVLHPLSHSLDSHSENLRQGLLRKDVSSPLKSDLETEDQLAEEDPTIEDTRTWEEFKNMSTNGAVEISLCKHLLYEGMGANAASQAFDAEKVDLEKFASLGRRLVKNDNLIARIGGRYFPWDAAASILSEMLILGHDQIFKPEGMIAVDRVEETIEGEPPAIVPPGGSWRLWPFGVKRSRTMNPVQPAPDCTKDSDVVNTAESTSDATGNKSMNITKIAKKKVKSIVPTSKQLATLNLKEGRNVITFTFSTAMLGKQQVDARIYLWKWNTRIVVSDVDGTITRSDVLGQFMPLVGKDWSQTGVANLFSAIKENGYQLLFLSARAISQAYLTRQFLFNLKQDGKALPDGPVVISPDGLFPSLFREVIRRAPHEFKIACLKDIRALFPPDCSPFYAGFGNRITDEISYLKVGIPKGKIFTINAKGEIAVNRRFDRKSYTSLHALVNGMFPATSSAEQEEFNSWNFWRMPLPDIKC